MLDNALSILEVGQVKRQSHSKGRCEPATSEIDEGCRFNSQSNVLSSTNKACCEQGKGICIEEYVARDLGNVEFEFRLCCRQNHRGLV